MMVGVSSIVVVAVVVVLVVVVANKKSFVIRAHYIIVCNIQRVPFVTTMSIFDVTLFSDSLNTIFVL